MKLVLEPRYLFDGSLAAVGHHAGMAEHDAVDALHGWTAEHADSFAHLAAPAFEPATILRRGGGETVLFVDPHVTDWQQLVAGVKPGVDVVVLNPNQDGITQVTQALAGLNNVQNIEFLADGTPGAITLGDTTLNAATLAARSGEIAGWSSHFASDAAVVFWGCNVAEGSVGQAFVADMHTLTGATVAASTDAVGAAALGGSWTLDDTTAALGRNVNPFTAAAMAAYPGILDTPDPTVTLGLTPGIATTTPGTVLLGDTLTANVTFQNTAINATGYAPYVELFVPNGLTLSGSPSYAGSSLTDLAATVTGGTVMNPLTKTSEAAPAGFTSGTMYVVELPYGSFTPGEPEISFSATFQMASTPALVGTTLAIDARGGFEYGAVATGGANIEGVSVNAADQVELIESYATVSTTYGEDETATGPDFPVQYTVHLLPAPAVTSGNAIDNLSLSLQLPNAVVWTGDAPTASGGGTASVGSAAADGGTVQTLTVGYAVLSGQQSITVPVYVPQNYQYTAGGETVGTPILNPSSGAPVEVAISPAYQYAANAWNGIALSAEQGNVAPADFYAKSLAVQLTADTSDALPGQAITYTMHFEVSDYFGVSGLTLNALMSDGLTVDTAVTPALTVAAANGGVGGSSSFAFTSANSGTVNGETVQTGGGGANWSYSFESATGTTALTFGVGAQLPGLYGAGTVGSLTFAGTILDKYASATDQVAGADGFLRETDTVNTSSANDPATSLFDYLGSASYSTSVGPIADDTDTPVDTLPAGSLTLSVAYVDGIAYTGQTIAPGDTVVYQLVYSLPDGGNFANLSLTAYLPEPVFSVLNPANPDVTTSTQFAGTGTSSFAETAVAAQALTSGSYTFSLSSGLASAGVTVSGGQGSEPTNSVSFAAQSPSALPFFNSGSQTPQTITVDLAVTASSQPFVNGLDLTAQGDSSFTPAHAATFTRQTITMVHMDDPLLAIDQGVVAITDDSGNSIDTASGVAWSNGASAAPTSLFAAAGGGSVFVNGATVPATLSDALDNLNLAGAQAGDTVRIVDAVQNTGGYPAYDVILKDALAQGLSPANVSNLTVTRGDGTVLTLLNPNTGALLSGTAAVDAFFSGTGALLTVAGATGTPVLSGVGANTDIVYVTYDVTLPNGTPTAGSLTGMASIVAWSNHDDYAPTGVGYTIKDPDGYDANFADDPALGAVLTDTATVTTPAPTLTDSITSVTDASDASATVPANTLPGNAATAVPGETVGLLATVTLPQGLSSGVTLTDILPAGLVPLTTIGSYTVTLHTNGGGTTDLTAEAVWNGQKLTLTLPNEQIDPATGGDKAATVTVAYQALVPQTQSTPLDTSGWSSATTGNATLKDSFAASSEGIGYGTTTATSTATTTGTASASGLANTVTVTNPLVTSSFTELNGTSGQSVYSQEAITYQVTLANTSASATAYDTSASIALPAGLTYVPGSLTEVSGGTGTVSTANVGSNGGAPAGSAIAGFTLAPGASAVFTFQATVNDNLAAGTVLKVTSQPAWNSLPASTTFDPGNVNPNAQAYIGAPGAAQNDVAAIVPQLSVIGGSNETANATPLFDPAGTTAPGAVAVTDGEIVRMRSTIQLPEGSNSNVAMTVTLPPGLTFQNDGSITVLLVSPNGDVVTTLSGANLQLAEGATAVNTAKLDLGTGADTADAPAAALPSGAIGQSGQTVTFNLGTLANNDASSVPNYAIVEFNAVVGATVANGTVLPTSMQASANPGPNTITTATVNDYLTVKAPDVTLAKQVGGIVYNTDGSVTVTYVDTVANTGGAPAYGLNLNDLGISSGTATYLGTAAGSPGGATGVAASASGTGIQATMTTLPAGDSQSFTYTVTIPAGQLALGITDAATKATVTSSPLNPALESAGLETLAGSTAAPPVDTATASDGLDAVSGTVNQDLNGTDTSLQGLSGQTVTASFTGLSGSDTVTTGPGGAYTILVPDGAGAVKIVASATGPTVPTDDAIDNQSALTAALSGTNPSVSGTNPATLNFTPQPDTNYSAVPFDFYRAPDTAPVLSGAPGSATAYTMASTPVAIFPAATVADTQLDAAFGHDFSGTTLTIQRIVSGTASPNPGDVFAGSGTATSGLFLNTANGQVLLNGAEIGTFTETGGKLTIAFAASGVTDTTVDAVLQHLTYSYTGGYDPSATTPVIGAQIDDANNDPIGLNGVAPDPAGPHDQGPGGDLLSNVLTSTVAITPPPVVPTLSVVGGSNETAMPTPLFDPAGQSAGSPVAVTDGEIVRMRATLNLYEGNDGTVTMTVMLPPGLTFQNDGSTKVLLVSPNGDFTTSLTGANVQLAEGGTAVASAKLDLGTGADTTDPVVAGLANGSIAPSGQTVTFTLGQLANNDGSTVPNYAVVEFNAVVGATVANGTALTSTMQGSANATPTATVSDYLTVQAPNVTLSKAVTGIVYNTDGSATVTYVDTVANTGGAPAYGLNLNDLGISNGTATYLGTAAGSPGGGTGVAASASGTGIQATMTTLPAGDSQSFTYTVTVPAGQLAQGITDAATKATVTSTPLNPALESAGLETLAGSTAAPPVDTATASDGLDAVSGTVNQDLNGTDTSLQGLPGQTITSSFNGLSGTDTVTTGPGGAYTILVPANAGQVQITSQVAGPTAPSNDALDNQSSLTGSLSGTSPAISGTNPATLSFTPQPNTNYPSVPFDYYQAPDTAPVLSNGPAGATDFAMGGTPVAIFPAATVADTQLDTQFGHDFSGTTLTVQRVVAGSAAPDAGDVFAGSGTATSGLFLNTANGQVLLNGAEIGTFTETGGKLTIAFAASGITDTTVDAVLQHLTYGYGGAANTLTPGVTIGAQIDDANNDPIGLNGVAPDPAGPHDQGPGGDLLSNVLTATVDVTPQSFADTFTKPNDANPAGAAVTVDGNANLADILHTSTPPSSITLTIGNAQAEDVLVFANTADIQGSYSGGVLTLTAVAGRTPTLTEWQAALQSVTYYDSSPVPDTTTRTLSIAIADGANSSTGTGTIAIVPVDDSPILDTSVPVALTDATEFQGTGTPAPSGAVGTPVSQLVGLSPGGSPANVTDPDGPGLTNGAQPTSTGIAITGFATADKGGTPEGTWYYTTNNGVTWTAFPSTISAQQPLDLAANARIVFQPTDPNFNGQIPNALTFRAWDGFDGTASGSQANLTGVTQFGQNASPNAPATAYSIATETLPLMVDNVNNAPVALGGATLPDVSSVTKAPPGESVTQLFNPSFSDTADQQFNPTANPTGSAANTLAGIAITSNAATPAQGVWEYSLDGGSHFTPIPTTVSATAAVILPAGAKIAFQPENGFSGTPGPLTAHLIDNSDTPIAAGLTGQSLSVDTTTAYSGVNVTQTGGATAISAAPVALNTFITPVPPPVNPPGPQPIIGPIPKPFPDDNTDPTDALGDDWLGRPLIPELSLVGSEADHYVIVAQRSVIALPPNLFIDSLPNAHMTFEAKRPDGSPLPSWLSFDPNSLTFYGTPPNNAVGRVEIVVTARDIVNNTASANFSILVGHNHRDLIGLISGRRPGGFRLSPGDIRHLQIGDAMPDGGHQPVADAAAGHRHAAATARPAPYAADPGGFSGALRGAGRMGALTRARALIDAVDSLIRA